VTKAADAPTITQAGVFTQHCLDIAVTTADASIAATDQYFIRQILEGLSTSFLGFGQSNARPITVSFWVKSTKTGPFGSLCAPRLAPVPMSPLMQSTPATPGNTSR
jgi:hypothetical protein